MKNNSYMQRVMAWHSIDLHQYWPTIAQRIIDYIHDVASDARIALARQDVPNPVLSKITVNNLERYTI